MFVLGGRGSLSPCEVINTSTNERYDLPPLNECRNGPTAVLHDGHLVVMGGRGNGWKLLATVECYSFHTKTWSYISPMTTLHAGDHVHLFIVERSM